MQRWLPLGVSLALVIETGAIARPAPETVVSQFYQWWVRNQDQGRQRLSQQRAVFTPDLYQQLMQAFRRQPRDGVWLDFDPFSFTQVSTQGVQVRNVGDRPIIPKWRKWILRLWQVCGGDRERLCRLKYSFAKGAIAGKLIT